MLRLLIGLPVAAIVTAGLFYFMAGLIEPGEFEEGVRRPAPELPVMPPERGPEPAPKPDPRATIDPPPPIRMIRSTPGEPGPIADLPPTEPFKGGPGPAVLPTGVIAIATIPPSYPPSCQSRATEGYAVVRYDVTFQGQVVNAAVTDRSHRCFEEAALSAIRSWRYQPAATKESGYLARGLTKRFTFTLN